MTNQKRGSAQLFHKARRKWDPTHGDDHPGGRPGKKKVDGGSKFQGRPGKPDGRQGKQGGRPIRGATGRRQKPGLHERPETNVLVVEEPVRPKRPEPERDERGNIIPKPRGLPGAQRLNQCIPAFFALVKKALTYPTAYEDHALGQTLVKLKNKSVVIGLGREGGGLQITAKLPKTGVSVISKFSWAEGAGHGLARKGWITAKFGPADEVPLRMLIGWVDESYQASASAPEKAGKRRS